MVIRAAFATRALAVMEPTRARADPLLADWSTNGAIVVIAALQAGSVAFAHSFWADAISGLADVTILATGTPLLVVVDLAALRLFTADVARSAGYGSARLAGTLAIAGFLAVADQAITARSANGEVLGNTTGERVAPGVNTRVVIRADRVVRRMLANAANAGIDGTGDPVVTVGIIETGDTRPLRAERGISRADVAAAAAIERITTELAHSDTRFPAPLLARRARAWFASRRGWTTGGLADAPQSPPLNLLWRAGRMSALRGGQAKYRAGNSPQRAEDMSAGGRCRESPCQFIEANVVHLPLHTT
jgi:hypothetical protein